MPNVVGIRFKPVTKIYFFLPPEEETEILAENDPVVVQTSRGTELGWVAHTTKFVADEEIKGTLKTVMRRATAVDLMQHEEHKNKEDEALQICKEKVADLKLPMKTVAAEYAYNGSRLTFLFCAEQRVDFRELVRVLARTFHTRVEMRQIGARDEAKVMDGYGRCGRRLCCSSWLTEFHPVSIKMAKNQALPLAPTEISGVCGRLLCCLAYEDDAYTQARKTMPKLGNTVTLETGEEGTIKGLNILRQSVIVEIEPSNRQEVAVDAIKISNTQNTATKKSTSKRHRRRKRGSSGNN